MAESSFPVDLANPGQVFACLGLMEAAEILLGEAEGKFDWVGEGPSRFILRSEGKDNPVRQVLEFLASATLEPVSPIQFPETFPTADVSEMALPIMIVEGNRPPIILSHWADGSSRDPFKLYSGNRSALMIARNMQSEIKKLWEQSQDAFLQRPFHTLVPVGGSFNFDARGAWTAIDAGYSPNDQGHLVEASPLVELLAALGLEHARPRREEERHVHYAVWGTMLPVMLARPALAGVLLFIPARHFRFRLGQSGRNSIITPAEEIPAP